MCAKRRFYKAQCDEAGDCKPYGLGHFRGACPANPSAERLNDVRVNEAWRFVQSGG